MLYYIYNCSFVHHYEIKIQVCVFMWVCALLASARLCWFMFCSVDLWNADLHCSTEWSQQGRN